MNQVEQLQGQFVVLVRRLERMEKLVRLQQATAAGAGEAVKVAAELGVSPESLLRFRGAEPRKRLARGLHERGWSNERIAKVMNCCERTVRRWVLEG